MANKNTAQVVLNVQAKDFVVKCGEDFARVLNDEIALLSGGTGKLELASFVNAFVKLSYDNYRYNIEIKKLNMLLQTKNAKSIKPN